MHDFNHIRPTLEWFLSKIGILLGFVMILVTYIHGLIVLISCEKLLLQDLSRRMMISERLHIDSPCFLLIGIGKVIDSLFLFFLIWVVESSNCVIFIFIPNFVVIFPIFETVLLLRFFSPGACLIDLVSEMSHGGCHHLQIDL